MRFRRKVAVFEDLHRPRLGERQERAAASSLRPKTGLLAVAGMCFKSGAEPQTRPRATHEEGGSCEQ